MAISNKNKERLNNMNKRARDAQLGTVIQTLQNNQNQDLAVGSLVIGDGAGAPSALDASGDGYIVVGNGTTATSVAVSGDVTLANDGEVTIAAGAVESSMLATGIMLPVSVEDAKTTSREENVAGLSSLLTLANSLKVTMNAHYADTGSSGEEHKDVTVSTAIASPDADSIASAVVLISEMQDSYVAHDADAAIGSPVDHQAQTSANSLASAANPTTLQTCITVANDLKAKLNLHMADSTSHSAGDSASEAAVDAAYGAAILVVDANVSVGDSVSWSILNDGTGNVTGVSAVAAAGGITFTFSADPQNDAIISYIAVTTLS